MQPRLFLPERPDGQRPQGGRPKGQRPTKKSLPVEQ